jgi:hypothetical protein
MAPWHRWRENGESISQQRAALMARINSYCNVAIMCNVNGIS